MKVDFLAWEFNSWLLGMRAFLDAISHAASETAATDAAEELKRRAEAAGWEAEEYFAEDDVLRENFEHWLPRLSTYSVVILLHSLVETELHKCARRLRRDQGLNLDVKDLYGTGITQAKTYLTKVASVPDISNDLGWQELANLQDLRNIIIHRRGRAGEFPEQLKVVQRLMAEYPEDLALSPARFHGVTNIAERELTVTFRLCSHFLAEIEGFFQRLFKAAGFASVPIQL